MYLHMCALYNTHTLEKALVSLSHPRYIHGLGPARKPYDAGPYYPQYTLYVVL